MRRTIALLALAALCGCRSTLAPEVRVRPTAEAESRVWGVDEGPIALAPELRALKATVEGELIVVTAVLTPRRGASPSSYRDDKHPWGGPWGAGSWGINGEISSGPDFFGWNSGYQGHYGPGTSYISGTRRTGAVVVLTYDDSSMRLTISRSVLDADGHASITLLALTGVAIGETYAVEVRAPHGSGQLAVE